MNLKVNYQQIEQEIAFKLIPFKQNQELLVKVPHRKCLDLAIIYYLPFYKTAGYLDYVVIDNSDIKEWIVSEKELYKVAIKNAPKLLKSELRSLDKGLQDFYRDLDSGTSIEYPQALEKIRQDIVDIQTKKNSTPVYVLSNQAHCNGAGCIIYPGMLENLANKLGGDLYVIPSSIHETLVIPENRERHPQELLELVKAVNRESLIAEEVLSDSVYYYRRGSNIIDFYQLASS